MDLPHPHQICVSLLPLITSSNPSRIPSSSLSQLSKSSHHFLNISPEHQPEQYLQPFSFDPQVVRLREELLESFQDIELGEPLFKVDDSHIKSLVPLGTNSLSIMLIWEEESLAARGGGFGHSALQEEEEEGLAGWKFLTLDRIDEEKQQHWYRELKLAVEELARKVASNLPSDQSTTVTSNATEPMSIKVSRPLKTREEMAEGEGTTPGAYGAAEDFWDGWNDDEEGPSGERGETKIDYGQDRIPFERDEMNEESNYWDNYADSSRGSVIDDDEAPASAMADEAQELVMQEDDTHFIPVSKPMTRSRRSSTIRVSDVRSAVEASLPSPAMTSIDATSIEEKTTPTLPTSALTSISNEAFASEVEGLQSALVGVWRLFSSNASTPAEKAQARATFLRLANLTVRS